MPGIQYTYSKINFQLEPSSDNLFNFLDALSTLRIDRKLKRAAGGSISVEKTIAGSKEPVYSGGLSGISGFWNAFV